MLLRAWRVARVATIRRNVVALSSVDEGEERRRWVPWFLLALLIVALGVAVVFIVQATRSEPESPTIPNSNLRRGVEAKVEKFDGCGRGSFPLIARLRDTAKHTTMQHYEVVQSQWDQADTVWVNSSSVALSGTDSGIPVCIFSTRQSSTHCVSDWSTALAAHNGRMSNDLKRELNDFCCVA
jgi:hypothetical protein